MGSPFFKHKILEKNRLESGKASRKDQFSNWLKRTGKSRMHS